MSDFTCHLSEYRIQEGFKLCDVTCSDSVHIIDIELSDRGYFRVSSIAGQSQSHRTFSNH